MKAAMNIGGWSWSRMLMRVAGATLCFHFAYGIPHLSVAMVGYLFCLMQLAQATTWRRAFYPGLLVGLLTAGPQLHFFRGIFGGGAVALWLVVAFWIGLFVAFARLCFLRLGVPRALLCVPFLWTGLEYFRSELYYLRFSWLNVGYTVADLSPLLPIAGLAGMYGLGFLAAALAAVLMRLRSLRTGLAAVLAAAILLMTAGHARAAVPEIAPDRSVIVAGVQLECPTDDEVIAALGKVLKAVPAAELLVLSEYTFQDVVPESVRRWCREHRRYLIVGGKEPAANGKFYNTAFVVGPDGDIVFQQAKSVPIQFFKDGLPAPEQKLWESPWGRIGICICYDLSYTRVTDRLVRLGAEALIVPTMDLTEWGRHEHELHARVAKVRAAEYGVPIFRVASSGISQLVDRSGRLVAQTGFPGERAVISGRLQLGAAGSLPLDRALAPVAVAVTALVLVWMLAVRASGPRQ